jgi:hypothetical protein
MLLRMRYVYVCVYIYIYICMYVCMYDAGLRWGIYTYTYIHTYTHTHTHTYTYLSCIHTIPKAYTHKSIKTNTHTGYQRNLLPLPYTLPDTTASRNSGPGRARRNPITGTRSPGRRPVAAKTYPPTAANARAGELLLIFFLSVCM